MMKLRYLFVLCLAGFIACGGGKPSKNSLLTTIQEAESEMYTEDQDYSFNAVKAAGLVDAYTNFTGLFPEDEKTPEFLFKSAEIFRSLKKFNQAIACYNQIIDKFPDFDKTPQSLFLLGFSYENDLNSTEDAKKTYTKFLEKYPKHELADDVQFSLDNIGISPEEIIKRFEQNQKKGEQAAS